MVHCLKRCLPGLLLIAVVQAQQLEVQRLSDQQSLVALPLTGQGHWCLHWQHSVAHFMVKDCFRIEDGQLFLSYSHQPDFAAGLDHVPGRGTLVGDGEGGYIIKGIDEPINNNELVLRVGSIQVDHRIVSAGKVTSLSAIAAGERVVIRLIQ